MAVQEQGSRTSEHTALRKEIWSRHREQIDQYIKKQCVHKSFYQFQKMLLLQEGYVGRSVSASQRHFRISSQLLETLVAANYPLAQYMASYRSDTSDQAISSTVAHILQECLKGAQAAQRAQDDDDKGCATHLFCMGQIFHHGIIGVIQPDRLKSIYWYRLAAQKKHPSAKTVISSLESLGIGRWDWQGANDVKLYGGLTDEDRHYAYLITLSQWNDMRCDMLENILHSRVFGMHMRLTNALYLNHFIRDVSLALDDKILYLFYFSSDRCNPRSCFNIYPSHSAKIKWRDLVPTPRDCDLTDEGARVLSNAENPRPTTTKARYYLRGQQVLWHTYTLLTQQLLKNVKKEEVEREEVEIEKIELWDNWDLTTPERVAGSLHDKHWEALLVLLDKMSLDNVFSDKEKIDKKKKLAMKEKILAMKKNFLTSDVILQ